MRDINLLMNNNINIQKSLELFGTIETYDSTVGVFLDTIEEKLKKMTEYKETSDMAKYSIKVHSLKNEARYFGFEELADAAYEHELNSKANDMYYVSSNFEELKREIIKMTKVIGQYLGRDADVITENNVVVSDNSACILIIDDSDAIKHFVKNIFQDKFEILTADNGQEGISIIENNTEKKIIGILLDLIMPEVNGFEVLDYLKEKNLFSKIPVCIITGVEMKEVEEYAFKYPIIDMLKKPFSEKAVKEKVEKFHLFAGN